MKNVAEQGTISMSRGSGWTWILRASPGNLWPKSAEALVKFYDSAGGTIAELWGDVSPERVVFEYGETDVVEIPHGAGYELFVTPLDTGIPQMVQYGTVARRELVFPDAPPTVISDTAVYFGDDFKRTILGPKWIIKHGKLRIYPGSGGGPNGVASEQSMTINGEKAAALYYAPLSGDDLTMHVKFDNVNEGQATMVFCSDYNMTSWIGLQVIESWVGLSNKVRIVRGYGPVSYTSQVSVNSTTADSDTFLIKYNSLTDSVHVYKNNSTTPLIEWEDEDHALLHGKGFRYVGLCVETAALLGTGPRITNWSAKDGL